MKNGDRKLVLVDVGARDGIHERWEPYWPQLEVIAFDADPVECERLNRQAHPYSVRYLPAALGAIDGVVGTLKLCRRPGCSSMLQPNREFCDQFPFGSQLEVIGELPNTLQRLDSVCTVQPDMLKIDTQGSELDILRGAGKLLDDTLAVELEVEFAPQYQDQPLFADIDQFMRSQGFMIRGLRRTFWRHAAESPNAGGGQLVHGDALYIRRERIDNPIGHIILAAYRQYDLLAQLGVESMIPRPGATQRALSRLLSRYPNRQLRRFIDGLRPPKASDWHDPDFY